MASTDINEHARSIAKALMEGKYGGLDADFEFDAEDAPESGYGSMGKYGGRGTDFFKANKKMLMIVAGILAATAIVSGGVWYYNKQKKDKK